ncbi:hypothetical protein [Aestuariibaculum sediminum]|uniref:Uncharacterized protein n=1 Tax=Aestuariibaculum sediminum TaxID=2770637 RepID=A0A8J6U7F2_9FLAO|nr:hypothetical protein [Aestuariibaculum sediminum]MBD0831810.1 hypothetical protein [Aestuariibaculum sediminum]
MTASKSPYYPMVKHHLKLDICELFIFKNFVIAEFKEGSCIGYPDFWEAHELIKKYFGNNQFGFITNRINSYAIEVTDANIFNDTFKNLKVFATVTYNGTTRKIAELENHFFKIQRSFFSNLTDAIIYVKYHLD